MMADVESIDALKDKIRKYESEKESILCMVKQLLERDKEREERLSVVSEENLQKTKEVQHYEALLKSRDRYLEECESDMNDMRNELDEAKNHRKAYVTNLEKRLFDLREQLSLKSNELANVEQQKMSVEKKLAEKERQLLEEVQRRNTPLCESPANITADSFMDSEILRLTEKTEQLDEQLNDAVNEIERLQKELIDRTRELENEQAKCEEIITMCNEYKRDAEGMRSRNAELTAQLEDGQNNVKFAKKGNSMFIEFVDERLKLEKDLIKLKSENDWLRAEKRNMDRELECMRQQLILALALPSSAANTGDVTTLQNEISALRAELDITKEKLIDLQKQPSSTILLDRTNPTNVGGMFSDIIVRTMSEESGRLKEKVVELERERRELFDQCTDNGCRLATESRRRKELESEVKSLQMQLQIARNSKRPLLIEQAKECLMERVATVQGYLSTGDSLMRLNDSTQFNNHDNNILSSEVVAPTTSASLINTSTNNSNNNNGESEVIENMERQEYCDAAEQCSNSALIHQHSSNDTTNVHAAAAVRIVDENNENQQPFDDEHLSAESHDIIATKRTKRVKFADEEMKSMNDETFDSMAASIVSSSTTFNVCDISSSVMSTSRQQRMPTRRRGKITQNVRDL